MNSFDLMDKYNLIGSEKSETTYSITPGKEILVSLFRKMTEEPSLN